MGGSSSSSSSSYYPFPVNTCFCCVDIATVKAPMNDEKVITEEMAESAVLGGDDDLQRNRYTDEQTSYAAKEASAPSEARAEKLKEKLQHALQIAGSKVGDGLMKALSK